MQLVFFGLMCLCLFLMWLNCGWVSEVDVFGKVSVFGLFVLVNKIKSVVVLMFLICLFCCVCGCCLVFVDQFQQCFVVWFDQVFDLIVVDFGNDDLIDFGCYFVEDVDFFYCFGLYQVVFGWRQVVYVMCFVVVQQEEFEQGYQVFVMYVFIEGVFVVYCQD